MKNIHNALVINDNVIPKSQSQSTPYMGNKIGIPKYKGSHQKPKGQQGCGCGKYPKKIDKKK